MNIIPQTPLLKSPQDIETFKVQEADNTQTESKDRPFNGFRRASSEPARLLVKEVSEAVLTYESIKSLRKRARKPEDQKAFENQIEALISDLAHRYITTSDEWLAVSFSNAKLGNLDRYRSTAVSKTIRDVIRTMAAPELQTAEHILGYRAFEPANNRQSVMRAGTWLRNRIDELGLTTLDFRLDKSQEIIILKDTKEDHWDKGKWLQYEDTLQTNVFREELNFINEWIYQADIEYIPYGSSDWKVDETDLRLYRYFNNGSFDQGGRLFGGFWQHLKKHQRKYIVIDGMDTVTLDYSQMVPRILYGLGGENIHFEDAYTIPGLEGYRGGVKKVFNAMLHTDKPLERKPQGTAELLPKDLSIAEITALIMEYHKSVANAFHTCKGLYLTSKESRILLTVLTRLIKLGITALPIHDAVIVAEDHQEQASQVMLDVFMELTGVEGIVRLD